MLEPVLRVTRPLPAPAEVVATMSVGCERIDHAAARHRVAPAVPSGSLVTPRPTGKAV